MTSLIQTEHLSKTYRVPIRPPGLRAACKSLFHPSFQEVQAVQDVSFSIASGELVGFIGPNGAGKTTTLKMLSGLLYPTAGAATAAGYVPWERKTAYLRQISMLMGNRSQLQWNNTVYDTMQIFGEIYNLPRSDLRRSLDELTAMLEVEPLLQKRARNLSLGERSKCELILALLHRPSIVYLDEPTLGMDVSMQLRLRQYIRRYNAQYGATILLTSHYMSDIVSLCPRVLLIHGGRLMYDGKLAALTDRLAPYRLVTLTLPDGNPPLTADTLRQQNIPAELTGREENTVTLRTRKEDAVAVLSALMGRYALASLTVAEPPIEAVIDRIYAEGGIA